MGYEKQTKDLYLIFLDTAKDLTFAANTWKLIDYSTLFAWATGEIEEDKDYICYANPVTEITGNKPELPQEIALYKGNPVYDFMVEEIKDMPIGESCKVPFLFCFPLAATLDALRGVATITSKTLDTVAGKITFTIKTGGNIERGTYTITEGVPTFVEPE